MSTASLTALHKLITPACINIHSCSRSLHSSGHVVLPCASLASFRASNWPIGCRSASSGADQSSDGEGKRSRRDGWREWLGSSHLQRLALASGAMAALAAAYLYDRRREGCGAGGSLATLTAVMFPTVLAKASRRQAEELKLSGLKLTHRERRFIKFASVEYQGQLYMTPQDFIESVTDSEPRQRLRRRQLTQDDLENFYQHTPALAKGTAKMFREIYDKGIMSYTEYLFLLSILTKPQTGFHIAFNMFDTDGNERVDKQEFLVLMELLNASVFRAYMTFINDYERDHPTDAKDARDPTLPVISTLYPESAESLESIFSTARRERLQRTDAGGANDDQEPETGALDDSLQKSHQVDTTLLVHFFGRKGKQDLRFEDFKMFMENLQTEVLQIEFNEFSKGLKTISELDFAKILLRYTHLQADQYEMYLERLIDKLPEEKGIRFDEFKSFCQFLNTLDDFGIAMRMYTLAEQPISQDEFHRAVRICTGHSLSAHIVDTVFNIFDDDGDGQLSYKEFIAIMKDRLHRGFKPNSRSEGWEAFKHCLKAEMKSVI